jgi:putative RNA 2'-phosphotransferase
MYTDRSTALSKFMSFVLRHKPQNFGLIPDQYGFVDLYAFLIVLKDRFRNIELSDIKKVVQNCPKQRFEIKEEKIRARYGHSFDVLPDTKPCEPPDYLYHGTSPAMKNTILIEGLMPMTRKYVHLSKTKEDAFSVGKRKSQNPILFIVNAREACRRGIKFYDLGVVMLTEKIPIEYLQLMDEF